MFLFWKLKVTSQSADNVSLLRSACSGFVLCTHTDFFNGCQLLYTHQGVFSLRFETCIVYSDWLSAVKLCEGGHVSAYCSVTLARWLPAVHTGQSRAGRSLPPRAWWPAPPWLWLGPASGGNACNRCLPPHRQSFSAAPPPSSAWSVTACSAADRVDACSRRGRGKWRWSLCINVHVILLKLSGVFWLVPK